ncbi:MAG: UDP-N-acetylglucosamine diphosphorylase [Oscillospiraceae bacterium]|nr:UDP-N-acetylglucosamine diphosphorylase [Oscillospiraceae bacterium]
MKNKTKEQAERLDRLEASGVIFVSRDGVVISPDAKLMPGVTIYPGTIVSGKSTIGANCTLGPNSIISDSQIGEGCVINSTQIYSSILENNVATGPFAHIRPNCVIKSGVKIGNFVEVKNSVIGEDTKAGHLTYIGDSDVGKNVNFGCGSITVNYDGKKKYRCNIKDGAFIGSNVNLIAPVTIGERAYTAAGSTLTRDVPDGALAISRLREQKIVENWAERKKTGEGEKTESEKKEEKNGGE